MCGRQTTTLSQSKEQSSYLYNYNIGKDFVQVPNLNLVIEGGLFIMQEIESKIRKIYQKNKIKVDDDYIQNIMKDEKRVKGFMQLYKQEEIDTMNYILGKPQDNLQFTKFELEALSKVDLFNRKVIEICKIIWANKDNDEKLRGFLKQLEEARTKLVERR